MEESIMLICKYCDKDCKNKNSQRNHERLCKENPNKQESNFKFVTKPWNKGLTKDDPRVAANAAAVSVALKGKPSKTVWTEKMRKEKSEWRKRLHEEHPEMHPNRKLAGNRSAMSYPEKVAYEYLQYLGVDFSHQKRIEGYYPDFVIGKIIIEIDGERWHNAEKDAIRDKKLNEAGYFVYRIRAKDNIQEKIKNILSV